MRRRIVVSIASVALCLGGLVVTQAGAATKTVSASGGAVRFTATVRNAETCGWSSSPTIAGFAKIVNCKTGTVSRAARFPANTTTTPKSYTVTLIVRGATTTVHHWRVVQAGRSATSLKAPYFEVTSIIIQQYGVLNSPGGFDSNQEMILEGTFQYLSKLTITDNSGTVGSCIYGGTITSSQTSTDALCMIYLVAGDSPPQTKLTSITLTSPGVPTKTISCPHLPPTVVAVANANDTITTFTVSSGTFSGTGSVEILNTVEFGTRPYACTAKVNSIQPTIASCQINEPLEVAQSYPVWLNWTGVNYIFDSAQGIPTTVPDGNTLTFDPSTNSWY